MSDDDTVGFGRPPKETRWQKGQSGNPKGRPKSRSEHMMDAARILVQPVEARGPDGTIIRLEAVEAAYLSLCKKGLKGHKTALLEAIRIMLELGPALDAAEAEQKATRDRVLQAFERMGVNLPPGFRPRDWRYSGLDFARDRSVTDRTPGRTPGASRYQGQPSAGPHHRGATMSRSPSTPPRDTKAAILRKLLSRKSGADLATLQSVTGWQPHSVRAAMSGLRKAGYRIDRAEPGKPGGDTVYRITGGPEGAQ